MSRPGIRVHEDGGFAYRQAEGEWVVVHPTGLIGRATEWDFKRDGWAAAEVVVLPEPDSADPISGQPTWTGFGEAFDLDNGSGEALLFDVADAAEAAADLERDAAIMLAAARAYRQQAGGSP